MYLLYLGHWLFLMRFHLQLLGEGTVRGRRAWSVEQGLRKVTQICQSLYHSIEYFFGQLTLFLTKAWSCSSPPPTDFSP